MPRLRRRFRHGPAFATVNEALDWVLAENDVYFCHKFMSHKCIRQWSIDQIQSAVSGIRLFKAEDVTDYHYTMPNRKGNDGTL